MVAQRISFLVTNQRLYKPLCLSVRHPPSAVRRQLSAVRHPPSAIYRRSVTTSDQGLQFATCGGYPAFFTALSVFLANLTS